MILSNMVINAKDWKDCPDMIALSIDEISEAQVSSVCSIPQLAKADENTIQYIYAICE